VDTSRYVPGNTHHDADTFTTIASPDGTPKHPTSHPLQKKKSVHKILSEKMAIDKDKYYSSLKSGKYQKHKPAAAAVSDFVMPSVLPSTAQLVLAQLYLGSTTFHSTEHG